MTDICLLPIQEEKKPANRMIRKQEQEDRVLSVKHYTLYECFVCKNIVYLEASLPEL